MGKYVTFNRDEWEAWRTGEGMTPLPAEVTTEQALADRGDEFPMIPIAPGLTHLEGAPIKITDLRDHVTTRALIYEVEGHRVPMVALDFASSIDIEHLTTQVIFGGSPESLRATGRLMRDTFNRAANVAEGKS